MVAVGLDGLDEAKAYDCMTKVAKHIDPKVKLSKQSGKVSEYVADAGGTKDSLFAAWPAKDVVVIGTKPEKRDQLDAYLAGKAASGDLASWIGKTSPTSPLAWGAGKLKADPDTKGAYATVSLANGTVTVAIRVVASDATAAGKVAKEAQRDLADAVHEFGTKAPTAAKAASAIKAAAIGSELAIEGSVKDADIAPIVDEIAKM